DDFVKDPRQVVNAGDRVTVRVLEVKLDRKQIALTMKSERGAVRSRPAENAGAGPRPGRPDRGGSGGGDGGNRGGQQRTPGHGGGGGQPRTPFNNPFASLGKPR